MCQRTNFLYHSHLLQDLVVEVLVWLPVETLIKFRCVSKSWRTLIDSTQFKQLHLRRIRSWTSSEEQTKVFFGWSEWQGKRGTESRHYVAEFGSRDKMLQKPLWELHCPFTHDKILERPEWQLVSHYKPENLNRIYGSCNGLICLGHSDDYTIVIMWNPCTNKYWKLPFYPLPTSGSESDSTICCYGFGYDEIADDYKVVRRVELWVEVYDEGHEEDDDPREILSSHEVIVYSLKSNSWTSLPQFPYSRLNYVANRGINGIHVNCGLHWLLKDNRDLDVGIWALDLRTYKCHPISLPLEMEGEKFGRLLALDGCLCMLPYHKSEQPLLDVWIMKNYGVKDSWTKITIQFSVTLFGDPCSTVARELYPIAYSPRSTELFICGARDVMWYNTVTEKGEWVLASMRRGKIRNAFQFIGSLIDPIPSLGGGRGISGENPGIKRVDTNLLMQSSEQMATPDPTMQMRELIKQMGNALL